MVHEHEEKDVEELDYDAELDRWLLAETAQSEEFFLFGIVRGDRKRRFRDGALIRTSILQTPLSGIAGGRIVETLNSRYLLGDQWDALGRSTN